MNNVLAFFTSPTKCGITAHKVICLAQNRLFANVFILTWALMVLVFPAHAQNIKGGVLAGINGTQVAGDVCSGYDKAGITGGVFANFKFGQNSMFQMELAYTQKGSRMNPTEKNAYTSYLLRLNYVDVPFLYKYLYNEKLSFEGGLSYGYLIDYYEEANGFTNVGGENQFHRHAANIIIGLNYTLNEHFRANFRSVNSLIPLRDHASGVKRLGNAGQYNDVLTLSVQYQF